MSSVLASTANVKQGNAFFTVLTNAAATDLLTAAGANASVVVAHVTAGTVLRDMGKTIRVPANLQAGTRPEILRKVQVVNTAAMTALVGGLPTNGFVGFNEGVGGDAEFYVRLVPGAYGVIVASTGC
jgi:hypothetical protein